MRRSRIFILVIFLTCACSPQWAQTPGFFANRNTPTTVQEVVSETPSSTTPEIAPETLPSATIAPTNLPTASSSPTPGIQICSPLEGYELGQIQAAIANPYRPPKPGSDYPHAGIDIADTLPGEHIALAGRTVQAAMEGQVAMVTLDRFPFGNAILIETPLDSLPEAWAASVPLPTLAPTIQPVPALTCPGNPSPQWDFGQRSLYLLYAHLQAAPVFKPGDKVICGQTLGTVGDSGNALNPHLHLEARLGPSGWRPASMAHYDSSASLEEMENYCTWSVRGVFQLVDPVSILNSP